MHHTQHSLKQALNKTLVLWAASFIVSLAIAVVFSFNALSDQTIENIRSSSTIWAGLAIILLVPLAIKVLHFTLQRQLIQPLKQLFQALDDSELDSKTIHQLEQALPNETANRLADYERLKHSHDDLKKQLSSMMQSLSCCFWWSDDGKTYAGMSEKSTEVLNQSPTDLQGSDLWAWTKGAIQTSGNSNRLFKAIKHQKKKLDIAYQVQRDDQLYWYGESITLSYDSDGKLDTIYGIINDINSRKNQQKQHAEQLELEQRMETTGTLVGGIAHEFNNALAGMNGNVFLIKQSIHDEKTLLRIGRIESLIERSAGMIDSMLCFAKKSNAQSKPVCLSDFFKKLQLAVLPTIMDKVHLELNCPASATDKECMVLADKKKLQEVILQLVANACSALVGVSAAQITIGLEKIEADDGLLHKHPRLASRHLMHCSFHDNGCGIPNEIQTRIFEPFFTTRDVGQGTGLGLSMVYGYIQQIGGAIEVESSPDTGTCFHIYFPCHTAAQHESLPDVLLLGDGEKILIVDDDKIFRESTCEVLHRMGYQTIEARDGAEAIQRFKQHQDIIKLIFMDILMPGMTGIQASKEIRQISTSIPIIYLTGYDRTEPMDIEVYAEHTELINKPFRISVLSQVIQKALKKNA